MRRHELTDRQWELISPHLPGQNHHPGRPPRTIVSSSMRCFGLPRPELRGAICPSGSANRTRFFSATTAGAGDACGSESSKPWVAILTWSICCSIPRLSGRISMPRVQKGARRPGIGSLAGRLDHENPRRREWRGPADPVFLDRWPATRHDASGTIARRPLRLSMSLRTKVTTAIRCVSRFASRGPSQSSRRVPVVAAVTMTGFATNSGTSSSGLSIE